MKKNLKKLLGCVCVLAFSVSVLTGTAMADEPEDAAKADAVAVSVTEEVPVVDTTGEAELIYSMINDPSTTDEDLEAMAAMYEAQGILSSVVYHLREYTDANPESAFFKAADELMYIPAPDVIGLNDEIADVKEEAEVVSTVIKSHTYEFDTMATSDVTVDGNATAETYGEAASVKQEIKLGSKPVSKIAWSFTLPMADSTTKSFTVAATKTAEGSEFKLPEMEVNGSVVIGIIINNWAASEPEISGDAAANYITTAFEYEEAAVSDNTVTEVVSSEPTTDETVTVEDNEVAVEDIPTEPTVSSEVIDTELDTVDTAASM